MSNTVGAALSYGVLSGPSEPQPVLNRTAVEPVSEDSGAGALRSPWVIFGSTFTTVFLAELGDKTQLATLLLSAQSGRPALVFLGASFALISTSLVGVLLGQWLSRHVAPRTLERLAGSLMLLLGVWIGAQALFHLLRAS